MLPRIPPEYVPVSATFPSPPSVRPTRRIQPTEKATKSGDALLQVLRHKEFAWEGVRKGVGYRDNAPANVYHHQERKDDH